MEPVGHVLTSRRILAQPETLGRAAPRRLHGLHRTAPVPELDSSPFDGPDLLRLEAALCDAERLASVDFAALLPEGAPPAALAAMRRSCTFAHCAVLLFPGTVDVAIRYFADRGLDPVPPVRSVLVRRRLCERYGLDDEACEVSVTRLRPGAVGGHHVEVFLFPRRASALRPEIIERERAFGMENHMAFDIAEPDERRLEQLMAVLQRDVGLVWEGGGHNRYEGSSGSSVFYFVGGRFDRWELHCEGDFSALIDRHPVDTARVSQVYASWTPAGSGKQ